MVAFANQTKITAKLRVKVAKECIDFPHSQVSASQVLGGLAHDPPFDAFSVMFSDELLV